MKERPILFTALMVRAILAGSKNLTRRVVQPRSDRGTGCPLAPCELAGEVNAGRFDNSAFAPGDRLWVRETWQHANYPLGPYQDGCPVYYRADYLDDPEGPDGERSPEGIYRTWRPSIFMPRSACRIVLEVTGVRVEKLHDITEAGAQAEGCAPAWLDATDNETVHAATAPTYRQGFARLWRDINGAGAWDVNPWVWVISFHRVNSGEEATC